MTSNTKNIKTSTCLTPKLILKPTSSKPIITTTTMFSPSSPIATGVFVLPIKQKSNRKGSRHSPKHLRKPPSFDTYLHSSATTPTPTHRGYMTRTPSLSSSYSSTSSLVDADEEMLYGYGSPKSSASTSSVHRHRRISSAYKVRFADIGDDGSSIVSSSSSIDEWDDMDIDEEEEDYIFISRQSPPANHYFNYHDKGGST
ncbi:unnamed protein product [Rhizophagus irregularis]|uniref:Uncharacterized protein n=3 Tax=Rhizophagus irregularis TaxID=588596 RepID=A0A2I1HUQ2_9GLOM|nr:hypothetical protein GLOIN_2v1740781 [Rhizophagus irregularis DAOM 181602=DAOM 197198]EXX59945.1 hypothetical protein RirG_184410 [Rhizophagus irregularis DAOM 197198w]PKC68976.1 hypothetical protein RhiirA1_416281 [Rhizophagus irregularis]PKY62610.1 hypothetical protein RhiirA4_413124 [Rhizophagus irregularis]POG53451.1 hypothetical protein GLOIN_2v1740781 [Rhizophagus irregularis DAOM 181602=DAOM 197198]UZO21041.1 hypothetical protein OCT59_013447 [Rhizophagus irregularis]|eukprot:XP_025164058.1 hypothetical protein GLOIN_2v1740781 [Rhizophagus irregularis DAOM 181602=DAOM 197198]